MVGISQIYTQLCAPFLIQFAMGEKEICFQEAVTG